VTVELDRVATAADRLSAVLDAMPSQGPPSPITVRMFMGAVQVLLDALDLAGLRQ
jgi:hypothetical protein